MGRALLAPELGTGLVLVTPELLEDPYSLRYELLEFAVYTLAARVGRLAPLHAACVGMRGRGALILGDSGAGKSTLAAQCLLDGFAFVAEDSVFLEPATLRAVGLASFLHLRPESTALLAAGAPPTATARKLQLARARRITRRSGVMKLEIDLRRGGFHLATRPLPLAALIFVSPMHAPDGKLLIPVGRTAARARLATTQPYAAAQAAWPVALRRLASVPTYELRRGSTPRSASAALRRLLCTSR